jgi:hypothetical protein
LSPRPRPGLLATLIFGTKRAGFPKTGRVPIALASAKPGSGSQLRRSRDILRGYPKEFFPSASIPRLAEKNFCDKLKAQSRKIFAAIIGPEGALST